MGQVDKHMHRFDLALYGGGAQVCRFDPAAYDTLSPQDRCLFETFGCGGTAKPDFPTVLAGFEHHTARNPENIAAWYEGDYLTYDTLNQRADSLATLLWEKGVRSGDYVGLFMHRSLELLIGMLAVMKLGAAYIPQHVGVAKRQTLEHIIHVANCPVVLTLSTLAGQVPQVENVSVLCVDRITSTSTTRAPKQPVKPDDTAFLLFTSGTTGTPNGVMVSHGNLANILLTHPGNLGMKPGLKVGQILSIAFDMAAWEILGALANGATLMIRGKDIGKTVAKVDIVISTPSVLSTIDPASCRNVKTVAVAGEPCPRPLAEEWASFTRFINSCGPTETTIINTADTYTCGDHDLTIGRPTPNNTVYILDHDLTPLPIGAVGEMWAGGQCVSKGYLANDALTNERYVDDPFLGGGRKMFRTRDLGSWTADGRLLHHGRVDDQVKIRGFRIELDSVSATLEMTKGCTCAVALKYDNRTLVAFVSPATVNTKTALQTVTEALPYYAVPALVLALDDFPKTTRGKVDKRALLAMVADHLNAKVAAQ